MNVYLHIFITELKEHSRWLLSWIFGIHIFTLTIAIVYPGIEGLEGFMSLADDTAVLSTFYDNLGARNLGYELWTGLMLPFVTIALFVFGLMIGVRITCKSISDATGELIHTLPPSRIVFLGIRWSIGLIGVLITYLLLVGIYSLPIHNEVIELSSLSIIFWWGLLFSILSTAIGVIIGAIIVDLEKSSQFALLLTVCLYALQLMRRFIDQLDFILKYNPLTWYQPELIIWGEKVPREIIGRILVTIPIFILGSFILYNSRDLISGTPVNNSALRKLSKFTSGLNKNTLKLSRRVKRNRSDYDAFLTRWARPFERYFPITADFIYSERVTILIMVLIILIIHPETLMNYDPRDIEYLASLQAINQNFGYTGINKVFTFGHNLQNNLFFDLLISEVFGIHFFYFIPLTAHWIRKILAADSYNQTGEIMASLPVDRSKVISQRIFAVFLELIAFNTILVGWLLAVEFSVDYSVNQIWEVIAIYAIVPIYMILLCFGVTLGLSCKNGITIARYGLLILLLLYIVNIVSDGPSVLTVFTIYGLYDPVEIIQDKSLIGANYKILSSLSLMVAFFMLCYKQSSKYRWVF